jgi:hypothetical protein
MKLVIEITPQLLSRLRRAVETGGYPGFAEFAVLALENQLGLEEGGPIEARTGNLPSMQPPEHAQPPEVFAPSSASSLSVADAGWLWGMINRLLPVKFACRALLKSGPTLLSSFRENTSQQATEFGAELMTATRSRGREDTLATGFPIKEPLFPARRRFENHFIGRLEAAGSPRGALFELGLAGVKGERNQATIALTEAGFQFASLSNPPIDKRDFSVALSAEEAAVYLARVAAVIPREADCFSMVLTTLRHGPVSVDGLNTAVQKHLPRYSMAALQGQKAGALGRLRDLGFIVRTTESSATNFRITDRGIHALEVLQPAAEFGGTGQ